MRSAHSRTLSLALLVLFTLAAYGGIPPTRPEHIAETEPRHTGWTDPILSGLPLVFIPNIGQADSLLVHSSQVIKTPC